MQDINKINEAPNSLSDSSELKSLSEESKDDEDYSSIETTKLK